MANPSHLTPTKPSTVHEIHLLILLPAPLHSAPIRCRLETTLLSSRPNYDILTSLWRTPSKQHPKEEEEAIITVNDAPCPVAQPTAAALRRLRRPSAPRSLWIDDAICVDQQRDRRLRPRIYAGARRLCVWMGEPAVVVAGVGMAVSPPAGLFSCPEWEARRPPRLSFVREAVLARRIVVVCGPDEVTWEAMGDSLEGEVGKGVGSGTVDFLRLFYVIKMLRQGWSSGEGGLSPCGLLYESRWLECEDPRDRIYGFLDLVPRILEAGVVPDYGTSVSTACIYADFARKTIQHSGCVDILNYAREWRNAAATLETAASDGADRLPSWAPNWAVRGEHDPAPLLDWLDDTPRYRTAKLMPARIQPHDDDNTLTLNGIRFDEVAALGTPWHPEASQPLTSRTGSKGLEQWEALALATPVSCPYGGGAEGRRAALWRTYIGDFAGDRSAPAGDSAVLERWYGPGPWPRGFSTSPAAEQQPPRNAFRDHLRDCARLLIGRDAGPAEYVRYARRVRRACAHRRLLVSKRGYVGLAPWNAAPGDVVAVLHGGSTPFLLRPGSVPGVYSLVGECFVYGIMDGEALAWEHATAAARDFRIV
ncbi:uncharacterized protein B0H64DRAFT_80781 [Chaetomium fimeti]|uniref:Heterokaryon incompatibility domain-containing protein n=1 Tax=Chaetomium fimeti TaxID=1854472 RepID=A0AAE0HLD8_9PEZI|nr:hypothetical protein B0H64DRAFT_80781 [Chaetomium fimeti]